MQPEADCLNLGPRRTALGYRLLLFFMINMKCPAVRTEQKHILQLQQTHFPVKTNRAKPHYLFPFAQYCHLKMLQFTHLSPWNSGARQCHVNIMRIMGGKNHFISSTVTMAAGFLDETGQKQNENGTISCSLQP